MSLTLVALVIGLLVVTIPLVALARRARIAYPIVLVLGGLALGFVPGLPSVHMNPNLVLLFFLPPLLYWESITAPTDVMWENRAQIGMLAIGLVLASTVAVAAIAHAVIPNLPWSVAFVFGAIVAPTDELASEPVLERFRIPRHLVAIVVGESLVNDALSLVLYAAAIAWSLTGVFDIWRTLLYLVGASLGSVVVGILAGRVAVEGWRRVRDTDLQSVISLLLPFVAYVPAQIIGTSGVLEVVTAGVYVNRYTPTVLTAESRLRLVGFWDTFVFVANAILFLLVGLQLHELATTVFARYSWASVLWYAVAVNVVVIVVRFAWILGTEYLPFIAASSEHAEPNWKHAFVASWSGLRGAVSLAAALAIPIVVSGGAPFPYRDLVIFLTFTVIVVTLVGGGLTLPFVVSALRIAGGEGEENEDLQRALAGASKAALERIGELESNGRMDSEHAGALRRRYENVRKRAASLGDDVARETVRRQTKAEREVIDAERQELIAMRERGEIDNAILRRVQQWLDLEQQRTK